MLKIPFLFPRIIVVQEVLLFQNILLVIKFLKINTIIIKVVIFKTIVKKYLTQYPDSLLT